jgi:hypothetical protein
MSGLLKRKPPKVYVFSVRLPVTKEEMKTLAKLADDAGFDLSASLAEHMLKGFTQMREELTKSTSKAPSNFAARTVNGTAEK